MSHSILYVKHAGTCEVLDSYYRSVIEWLEKEKFVKKVAVEETGVQDDVGFLSFRPNSNDQWHLFYTGNESSKDRITDGIVMGKLDWGRLGQNERQWYSVMSFQCSLGDPSLWERTLYALQQFRYAHWPT